MPQIMLDLPMQDPPPGIFSSHALVWTASVAYIPWARVQDFVDGEGRRDIEMEASFSIRDSKRSSKEKANWMIKKVFWCSYGPQEEPMCLPAIPPLKGTHPTEGPGSRPRAVKRVFNNHSKRGCRCHFQVKRYKATPHVVEILYKNRDHVNKQGKQIHGSIKDLDLANVTWGPRLLVAPRLTHDFRKTLMDLLRAGWRVLDVFYLHCQNQFDREGEDRDIDSHTLVDSLTTLDGRDDLVSLRDLYNLKVKVASENSLHDSNDQKSMGIWIENNQERVLIHQEYKKGPPETDFMLALQSPWQLANMVAMSHGSVLAMDSTFATNKYMYPFFTLVSFDKHQMGFPAAWSIQMRETTEQIVLFLEAVKARALRLKPDWRPACFIIDCAEAEVSALQAVFPRTPIYFCSWHVRRAWKDNIIKKVTNRARIVEMSDDLGDIMYAPDHDKMQSLWKAFCSKYHDEKPFCDYFQKQWLGQSETWMRAVRTMNRANQNTNGATEAWHLTLKKMIARKIGDIGSMRLDAVIDMLFTCMLPFFHFNQRCKNVGRKINYKKEEIIVSSLQLAQFELKDHQVSFPDPDKPNQAVVKSSTKEGKDYVVRNIYSSFPSCSCQWADEGNMCKHQLKALLVRGHDGGVLVQQLGTRFGSQMGGIAHLASSQTDSLAISLSPTLPLPALESLQNGDESWMQLDASPQVPGEDLLIAAQTQGVDGTGVEGFETNARMRERKVEAMKAAWLEMIGMVEKHDVLAEKALFCFQQNLSQVKKLAESLKISGKDILPTNDKFLRPLHITSARRLGVIDKYHGGRRGKRVRVDDDPKKKRGIRNTNKDTATQEPITKEDANALVVVVPDQLPRLKRLERESHREQLGRLQENFIQGKTQKRRSAKNQAKIIFPKRPSTNFEGLDRELHSGYIDLDVNVDCNIVNIADS